MLALAERRRGGRLQRDGPGAAADHGGAARGDPGRDRQRRQADWVGRGTLVGDGVEAWSDLPLWLAPGTNPESANFLAVDVSKAVAAGLRFRPLAETVRDTLEQAETSPRRASTPTRERELLTL